MATCTVQEWIIASINRIVSGETFTRKDFDAQPLNGWEEIEPKSGIARSDQEPAYFAWMALRRWADDADIRAKDHEYREMRKRELQGLLKQIGEQ
jgi:hypothetical protein